MNITPICRTVKIFAFRGDRSRSFVTAFHTKLTEEKNGRGPGPTAEECQVYLGHTAVSADDGATKCGFSPDARIIPIWELLNRLKSGERLPGVVRDDTAVFTAALSKKLILVSFDVVLPDREFLEFQSKLDAEREGSQYYYGFPNSDGDCNCTTWLERLGLPLLTGRMDEFIGLPRRFLIPSRRFGRCV